MPTLIKFLDHTLSRISVLLMSVLVINVLLQIFMRYIVGSPVTFTEELARYLLIWLGFIAASYAYGQRMHLALDLMVNKLKDGKKTALNIVIHSLIALFAISVLVYGGLHLVYLTYILEQYSPALGVSLGVIYIVLPLSGIAIILYAIDFILQEMGMSEKKVLQSPEQENIHAE